MQDLIRSHSESYADGYSGTEVTVRGHRLPTDYWVVIRTADGFVTRDGLFRFFPVQGEGGVVERSSSEWVASYGHLLDGFVPVAEDVFGDLYGYAFDGTEHCSLAKFLCEGGHREACDPRDLADFLAARVLVERPDAFDATLATDALAAGIRPKMHEHLAFSVPLIAGGDYALENLSVESVALHLGLLGQMSLANASISDGTPIGGFSVEPDP